MNGKRTSETKVTIAEVIQPHEANFLGKMFGGALLAKIDLCAYATASKYSSAVTVTASFDRVDFHEPIEVAELVTLVGQVVFVGRTSIEVYVEVYAENIMTGVKRHTNTARVTMVALKDGKPCEVPRLIIETQEDKARYLQAKLRREMIASMRSHRAMLETKIYNSTEAELDYYLTLNELETAIENA